MSEDEFFGEQDLEDEGPEDGLAQAEQRALWERHRTLGFKDAMDASKEGALQVIHAHRHTHTHMHMHTNAHPN